MQARTAVRAWSRATSHPFVSLSTFLTDSQRLRSSSAHCTSSLNCPTARSRSRKAVSPHGFLAHPCHVELRHQRRPACRIERSDTYSLMGSSWVPKCEPALHLSHADSAEGMRTNPEENEQHISRRNFSTAWRIRSHLLEQCKPRGLYKCATGKISFQRHGCRNVARREDV